MGASLSRKEGNPFAQAEDFNMPKHSRNDAFAAWGSVTPSLESPYQGFADDGEVMEQEYVLSGPLRPMDENNLPSAWNQGGKVEKSKQAAGVIEKAKTAKLRTTVVAKKGAAKVYEVGSLVGKAGLGKAVYALDTLGSSMTSLNSGNSFASGAASKGNKIDILSFEVANTIVKAYNLKHSVSAESIKVLKIEVLSSEGVQRLVSTNFAELLTIAAVDKRKEFEVFAKEVVRFGNQCRDPQWHSLDRYFDKLGTEVLALRQSREEVEEEMQVLVVWARQTAELYHELNSLDRFEAEIRRKLQDEDLYGNYSRGDGISALRGELRNRKKNVKNLKKKSLWSKTLEEVMEKLVDVVYFLHVEIQNAFGNTVKDFDESSNLVKKGIPERLGSLGLALHYASIINQIDGLVLRPGSFPADTRDNLYQSLPAKVKADLRFRLLPSKMKNEFTLIQVKEEMEMMLAWLAPIATNTIKAHHGFGWVGEWANTGSRVDTELLAQSQVALIQTLHHAHWRVAEGYLLELVLLLHHLVLLSKDNALTETRSSPHHRQFRQSPPEPKSPDKPRAARGAYIHELSSEDHNMLQHLSDSDMRPGISKSLDFDRRSRDSESVQLTKCSSHSSRTLSEAESLEIINHIRSLPVIDFSTDKEKTLDVIDRVDGI